MIVDCVGTGRNYGPFENVHPEVIVGDQFPCNITVQTTHSNIQQSSRVIVGFGDSTSPDIVSFTSTTNKYTFSLNHTYNSSQTFYIAVTYHNMVTNETITQLANVIAITCKQIKLKQY